MYPESLSQSPGRAADVRAMTLLNMRMERSFVINPRALVG
jgi:hypothetical protein